MINRFQQLTSLETAPPERSTKERRQTAPKLVSFRQPSPFAPPFTGRRSEIGFVSSSTPFYPPNRSRIGFVSPAALRPRYLHPNRSQIVVRSVSRPRLPIHKCRFQLGFVSQNSIPPYHKTDSRHEPLSDWVRSVNHPSHSPTAPKLGSFRQTSSTVATRPIHPHHPAATCRLRETQ